MTSDEASALPSEDWSEVTSMRNPFHGSVDTDQKLSKLQEYLRTYSIAMEEQKFARLYIDAFAGTGSKTSFYDGLPLFDGVSSEPNVVHTPGSARIALEIEPPFHTVALIEQDPDRFAELEKLRAEFPGHKIVLKHGDANENVRRICKGVPWHVPKGGILGMRGVIFLDPFGMEVDWTTVEAIAATKALDCWYFFPLSGLYRNAPHNPAKLDEAKKKALDRVLGTTDWRDRWYSKQPSRTTLFETEEESIVRADVDAIEAYVAARLRTVFKGTVMGPLRLRHNGGAPMASLFFAVANESPKAVGLARRIAGHILRDGISSHVDPR